MNQKNLTLFVGIMTALVFIGFLGETEPQNLFGYSVTVWVFRLAYLFLTIFFFSRYFKLKQLEKEAN